MHLRHIRPKSTEWYDAVLEEAGADLGGRRPEAAGRPRALEARDDGPGAAERPRPPRTLRVGRS
jgi:hypothetical protein